MMNTDLRSEWGSITCSTVVDTKYKKISVERTVRRKEKEEIEILNAVMMWILICFTGKVGLDEVVIGLLLSSLIALDEISCLLSDGVHYSLNVTR